MLPVSSTVMHRGNVAAILIAFAAYASAQDPFDPPTAVPT